MSEASRKRERRLRAICRKCGEDFRVKTKAIDGEAKLRSLVANHEIHCKGAK